MTVWNKVGMVIGALVAVIGFVSLELLPDSRAHGVIAIAVGVLVFVIAWVMRPSQKRH